MCKIELCVCENPIFIMHFNIVSVCNSSYMPLSLLRKYGTSADYFQMEHSIITDH